MVESARAKQAWADYVAIGPDRSLEKLLNLYQTRSRAPTKQLTTLKEWSSAFGWQRRLQEIAEREAQEAEAQEAAYRRKVMESGFALAHKRVEGLNVLAERLLADLTAAEDSRLWLPDVKGIGGGDSWERVELERFNDAEVAQLRGLLDDIAKETGERVRKTEVTGRNGGPVEVAVSWADAVSEAWERRQREGKAS